MDEISIVIPTYNERENIVALVIKIRKVLKNSRMKGEIIVVDDNSPDGTWKLVEDLSKKHDEVRLMRRMKKEGLGAALKQAYDDAKGYVILSIDSDFSHDPWAIPDFYRKIKNGYDFVIGSRYVKGGLMKNKPAHKRIMSRVAAKFASIILGMNFHDYTNNFRAFRRDRWKKVSNSVNSKSNVFLAECIYRFKENGYRICEIPIVFRERKFGKSKMNMFKETFLFVVTLLKIRLGLA